MKLLFSQQISIISICEVRQFVVHGHPETKQPAQNGATFLINKLINIYFLIFSIIIETIRLEEILNQ